MRLISGCLGRVDSSEGVKLVEEYLKGDFFFQPKHVAEYKDYAREQKLFTEVSIQPKYICMYAIFW